MQVQFEHYISDIWLCSDGCQRQYYDDKRIDRVLEYSKSLLWEGLNHLVRRDAVREGDGNAMMQHWSMDLVQFANNGHYKYTILAHQMLFGKCIVPLTIFRRKYML